MVKPTPRDRSSTPLDPVKIARWLVHSNVYISLAATSWAVVTIVLTSRPIAALPLFIVFTAALFVYSVNRVTDLAEDEANVPNRAAFTRRFGYPILGIGVLAYLVAIGVAIALDVRGAVYLLIPPLITAGYTVGLKRVLLVKNLVVGLAWGAIPLGVGVYYDFLWTVDIWLLAAYVTIMLTLAAAIFDIKDIQGDRAEDISTVPARYGPRATRVVSQTLNLSVAAIVLGLVTTGVVDPPYLSLLAFHAYVGAYIPFASRDRGPLFYGFVVDGEHLFLLVVVCLVHVLK